MCEKEPKHKSCTTCPQYDGMKCTATDFALGDRDEVLHQEHRRGFICLDTGEAELKGDAVLQWTVEQERLSQEKGYKSVEEMWAAEGKQVMCGFRIDKDNKHLEPLAQISNGPGPVKLTFQYEENAKSVDDTMYHPNSVTADCIADMLHKGEGGAFTSMFTGSKMPDGIIHMVDCNPAHAQFQYRPEALPKYAGSPSSECPSRRDGPPQKGKIGQNMVQYTANRLAAMRDPDGTCDKCSHCQDGYCHQWHMQIHMPHIPCGYWRLGKNKADWCIATQDTESPLSTYVDNASLPTGRIIAGSGLQYVENPPPLFKDLNGYWEPVRPRSCTNCKLYNDPICMKMATHIGTRQEILTKEEENGFHCFAADQMQRDE